MTRSIKVVEIDAEPDARTPWCFYCRVQLTPGHNPSQCKRIWIALMREPIAQH